MLWLRIPARPVIRPGVEQVLKYYETGFRGSGRIITLRSPKIPLEGNGTLEKKDERCVVFFSLPVDLFLVSLVRPYVNRLGCLASTKRTPTLSRRARRVLWS